MEDQHDFVVYMEQSTNNLPVEPTYPLLLRLLMSEIQIIEEDTMDVVYIWPFSCISRYGVCKSQLYLTLGQKCSSGAGLVIFSITEGEKLKNALYAAIQVYRGKRIQRRESKTSTTDRAIMSTSSRTTLQLESRKLKSDQLQADSSSVSKNKALIKQQPENPLNNVRLSVNRLQTDPLFGSQRNSNSASQARYNTASRKMAHGNSSTNVNQESRAPLEQSKHSLPSTMYQQGQLSKTLLQNEHIRINKEKPQSSRKVSGAARYGQSEQKTTQNQNQILTKRPSIARPRPVKKNSSSGTLLSLMEPSTLGVVASFAGMSIGGGVIGAASDQRVANQAYQQRIDPRSDRAEAQRLREKGRYQLRQVPKDAAAEAMNDVHDEEGKKPKATESLSKRVLAHSNVSDDSAEFDDDDPVGIEFGDEQGHLGDTKLHGGYQPGISGKTIAVDRYGHFEVQVPSVPDVPVKKTEQENIKLNPQMSLVAGDSLLPIDKTTEGSLAKITQARLEKAHYQGTSSSAFVQQSSHEPFSPTTEAELELYHHRVSPQPEAAGSDLLGYPEDNFNIYNNQQQHYEDETAIHMADCDNIEQGGFKSDLMLNRHAIMRSDTGRSSDPESLESFHGKRYHSSEDNEVDDDDEDGHRDNYTRADEYSPDIEDSDRHHSGRHRSDSNNSDHWLQSSSSRRESFSLTTQPSTLNESELDYF